MLLYLIPQTKKFASKTTNEFVGITSAYLYLLADIKNEDNSLVFFNQSWKDLNPYLVYGGIVLALIYLFLNYKNKNQYITDVELSNKIDTLEEKFKSSKSEFYKLCSDIIKSDFSDFFNNSENNGRISIYKFEDNKFYLLGRYSSNPAFNKSSRDYYPANEGFIAKGWENVTYSVNGVSKHRGKGRDWKKSIKNKCHISDSTLNKIRMKSCSFYIKRIRNEDSRDPLGIIVAEQISPEEINSEHITKPIEQHHEVISSLIKSMKTLSK
jgi:hypothetical protein